VRVSTSRQAERGLSLEQQQDAARAEIDRREWTLAETYVERGVSGAKDSRPELDRMLADAETGEFDALVIPKLDRLGRSARGLFNVHSRLRDAGVELVCLSPIIDATTPSGRAQLGMLAVFAEFEREMIAERTRDAQAKQVASGRHTGRAPLGYDKVAGDLVINDLERQLVARIFADFVGGRSQQAIARQLDREGLGTKTGGRWYQGTVAKVLASRVYRGEIHSGDQWLPGTHPPIIDESTWQAAASLREITRRGDGRGRRTEGLHIFRGGLLRCGCCGESMVPRKDSDTYYCIATKRRDVSDPDRCPMPPVPRAMVDEAVLRYFQRVGLDVEATAHALQDAVDRALAGARAPRQRAEQDELRAEQRLLRVRRDYQDSKLDADDWNEQRLSLTAEREAAGAQVAEWLKRERAIIEDQAAFDVEAETLRRLATLRRAVVERLAGAADIDALRAALTQLFDRFTLHSEDLAAETGDAPPVTYGWQPDLFMRDGRDWTWYLEPHVRAVVVDGFDPPADMAQYAPPEAFPVLKRVPVQLDEHNAYKSLIM
jgi:DNA invertase Pin-like site-specific DNA recombinase